MASTVAHTAQDSRQFVTFLLDEHEYGLEILQIREIRGYAPITPIPNVPLHVRGVMNLRGTVLPVIDMRTRFNLPPIEYSRYTVIVIASVGTKTVGLLVDAVSDVLTVEKNKIQEAPDFGSGIDTRFISGVFQSRERLAVALDLNNLLVENELELAAAAA